MGFWGIEVKPDKPRPYHSDNAQGKLHVTQATLGLGSSSERSILQCSVGNKKPIFLCSLLPNKNESCSLNLEFDEEDMVAFSVIGARSIHLSGYFVADSEDHLRDEYDSDSYGVDIEESETDESSEYDTEDEYDDEFIDDDDDMFPPSPVPNSGVVIEEIVDDDKPLNGNGQSKRLKKKDKLSNSEQQIVVKSGAGVSILESEDEDEDGFPIFTSNKSDGAQVEVEKKTDKRANEDTEKNKAKDSSDHDAIKKRKVKTIDHDDQPERKKKKKKQKEKGEEGQVNQAASGEETNDLSKGGNQHEKNINQKDIDNDASAVPSENQSEKKKKKKKNKKKAQESEGQTKEDQTALAREVKNDSALSPETSAKSSKVRTFPNGLVIEEVAMGKPDGKRASPGKQVSVRYIGKLKKNGKIFDSNVGRAPFKFRLGIGQVIKGWDVGVNGMRVGDKRRLTIPPAMGYGAKGAGGQIPPNSWLEFDVELIDVR